VIKRGGYVESWFAHPCTWKLIEWAKSNGGLAALTCS